MQYPILHLIKKIGDFVLLKIRNKRLKEIYNKDFLKSK